MILNEGYNSKSRATAARNQFIKIDSRWCLDTSMGAGTHLFGHHKIRTKGDLFIYPNKLVDEASDMLYAISGMPHTIWCNTGTEAVMRALRIARAYTGRDKVAMYCGGWHGTSDNTLVGISKGIPKVFNDLLITLQFNESDFLKIQSKELAAVIVEPIQASLPIDRSEYLAKLQGVCKASGTVLIFDELISGFRCGISGSIGYYNITPDLVCYGKILGGGLPVGAVCGDGILDNLTGVRFGGTFSANPATIEQSIKILGLLFKTDIYQNFFALVNALNVKSNYYQIMTLAGMARIIYSADTIRTITERESEWPKERQDHIRKKALDKGIYLNSNNCIMLSTKHTIKDVNRIIQVLDETVKP